MDETVETDVVYDLRSVGKVHRLGNTDVHALCGVDLSVRTGESVAVVGRSGSGKSTLLSILGLLDHPSSGSVRFLGRDPAALSDPELSRIRGRRIGFVFQSFRLLRDESAVDNVALPLVYAGVRNARERALEALRRVGLADRARHRPEQLSGGERQRVAIARALVKRPAVVLADEPTGNLDTTTGDEVMDLLTEIHRAGGTLVVVTHDKRVARRCERVVTLEDGRIVPG